VLPSAFVAPIVNVAGCRTDAGGSYPGVQNRYTGVALIWKNRVSWFENSKGHAGHAVASRRHCPVPVGVMR
jgi:hypothetical protein